MWHVDNGAEVLLKKNRTSSESEIVVPVCAKGLTK